MAAERDATLAYVAKRFNLDLNSQELPICIPNTDRGALVNMFAELGFKEGVEVGVMAGSYSYHLCQVIPDLKLHCVDIWEKYPGYIDIVDPEKYHTNEKQARELLAPYGCNIIKAYSMDAVKQFPDRSLDFAYIDAAHDIRHVIDDVEEWGKKIRRGGIIAGHDYEPPWNERSRGHVIQALQAYTISWHIRPWFVLGRQEKVPGERRERVRSWFWVI